ncbi:alpha/beta hydrolase-fold protein [Dyella sp. KULCS107]|uniref:alpha/beta hydrolase-fold protein n=1 Tax=Dyella sp. KULCS107 TaxID=3422216 RepID=UPI003D6EBF73
MDRRRPLLSLLACLSFWLGGCAAGGDPRRPIPTTLIPAKAPTGQLVVVLPGRGDNLDSLTRTGIAQIIQQKWPGADVMLTGLTMPYYRQGQATVRLHGEIMAPARERYRQVWLVGISLGGLGALLYDQAHPDEAAGLLLLSPYLGDRAIHREIRTAGGLDAWQPGPPQPLGPATFQHELWRSLRDWSHRPERTRTTWVAYGASERFRRSIELMSPQLPASHVLMLPGHHNWKLWRGALEALLDRAGTPQP